MRREWDWFSFLPARAVYFFNLHLPWNSVFAKKLPLSMTEIEKFKILRRHLWEDYRDEIYEFTQTEQGKKIYDRRKETIERSFADSKEFHGLRYCRMRGLKRFLSKVY